MTTLVKQRIDDFTPANWEIIPFGPDCPLTDDLLERLGTILPARKLERTADGKLAIGPPIKHDGSPEYLADMGFQIGIWSKSGRGVAASGSKGYADGETSEVHSPDLSWISSEQAAAAPKPGRDQGMFVGVPEFAIEIMSKSDSIPDHIRRCRAWIERGVQVMWMIDPFNRTLRIFRAEDPGDAEPEFLDAGGKIAVGPLMPGFELDFDQVWSVWD